MKSEKKHYRIIETKLQPIFQSTDIRLEEATHGNRSIHSTQNSKIPVKQHKLVTQRHQKEKVRQLDNIT